MSPLAVEVRTVKTETPQEPLVRRFMPELDVLRGIAVLGVLFFHGFRAEYGELPFTGARRIFLLATQPGALGVNLFFVLSGFLITGILLDSRSKPDYYRRFYTRRALRILPAYYSLLILLGLLHQASPAFLGLSFVYLSNVTGLFGVSMDYHPLWSLAVEEHYYIVWPSVVRKLRPRYLAMFSLAICIFIPIARAVSFHYGHFQGEDWYTWFAADGLAAGSLLALVLRTSIRRTGAKAGAAFLLTGATILLIAGAPFGVMSRQTMLGASLQLTLVNAFFAGVLLLFLVVGSSSNKRLVNSPSLQFFGYISYGLYLIHPMIFRIYDQVTQAFWPWLQPSAGPFSLIVLRFAIVSAAAVGLSYLSRKYYEEWFLRLKDRVAPKPAETPVKVIVTAPPASLAAREASEPL
jgi:peptidoglycan/LPS O-acetylase OafA/YrhL